MSLRSPSGRHELVVYVEDDRDRPQTRWLRLAVRSRDSDETPLDERYPAWFHLRGGWDAQDRLWIHSGDTGTSVYGPTAAGWRRGIWDPDASDVDGVRTIFDVETGRDLDVIVGEPPLLVELPLDQHAE